MEHDDTAASSPQEMIALRRMVAARDEIDHELGQMRSTADSAPCLPATRASDTGRLHLAEPAEVATRVPCSRLLACANVARRRCPSLTASPSAPRVAVDDAPLSPHRLPLLVLLSMMHTAGARRSEEPTAGRKSSDAAVGSAAERLSAHSTGLAAAQRPAPDHARGRAPPDGLLTAETRDGRALGQRRKSERIRAQHRGDLGRR